MISNPRTISEDCSEISPKDFSNGSFSCGVRSFPIIFNLVLGDQLRADILSITGCNSSLVKTFVVIIFPVYGMCRFTLLSTL